MKFKFGFLLLTLWSLSLTAARINSGGSGGGAGVNCTAGTNGQAYVTNGTTCSFQTLSGTGNITDINADATPAQTLSVGTTGTDFAIVDNGTGGHSFNLPSASTSARGVITTGAQNIAGAKSGKGAWDWSLTSTNANVAYLSFDFPNVTASADGTYTWTGIDLAAYAPAIATTKTNSGVFQSVKLFGGRGRAADQGTLTSLIGLNAIYGHLTGLDAGAVTTNAYGIFLQPYGQVGTITNRYGVYIAAPATGGTVTNDFGFYQAGAGLNVFNDSVRVNYSTASRALVTDANKNVVAATTTATEIGYVNGVTSGIQAQIDALKIESFVGFLVAPTDYTYVLDEKAVFAYTINTATFDLTSGTLTAALKINGTNVTSCSAISVTGTQGTTTCTAANAVALTDRVTMVLSSSSSPVDLAFTIKYTR